MLIDDDKLEILLSKVNPCECSRCHKKMILDDIDTLQETITYKCIKCGTQQKDLFVLNMTR